MEMSFEVLYEKYKGCVMNIALKVLNDRTLAEDAFQETFLALSQNMGKIDQNPEKAKRYIKTTARNAAISVYRKYRLIRKVELRFPDEEIKTGKISLKKVQYHNELLTESFEAELVKNVDKALLIESLNELDQVYLVFIIDYYFKKMSYEQIAEKHGINVEAAKKRVYRSVDKLKILFEKKEEKNV